MSENNPQEELTALGESGKGREETRKPTAML